jgi:hypothetical protein
VGDASQQAEILLYPAHYYDTFGMHTAYVTCEMKTKRAHILLPQDLVREIDAIVGPRGRSAFLVETAREAVRRRKLLRFLENDTPVWTHADHPELARGAAAWVRGLRQENEQRHGKKRRGKR